MNKNRITTRKIATSLFALSGALAALTAPAFAQDVEVQLNGRTLPFNDVPPQTIGGRVLVPLRGVFEAMNATVVYQASTRKIIAQRGSTDINLTVGSTQALVNGRTITLDTPAQSDGGRVLVPLRFVAEALGARVDWNNATRLVSIYSGNNSTNPPPINDNPPINAPSRAVTVRVRADKRNYQRGERVAFTIILRNTGNEVANLRFPSGQNFDLIVEPAGGARTPRWQWSEGRNFTAQMQEVRLQPGETKQWTAEWNQRTNNGQVAPRGNYTVRAEASTRNPITAEPTTIRLSN